MFTGIGEFTIHGDIVAAKIAGKVASLQDAALDRVLDFAAEGAFVVRTHPDIDVPCTRKGSAPVCLDQIKAVFRRHAGATIIRARTGMTRITAVSP